MNSTHRRRTPVVCASCLAAVLAAPLAGCSDSPEEKRPPTEQPQALELARQKEAERRPGAGEPVMEPKQMDYADGYSKPRESWAAGGTARDAGFTGTAATDTRAEQQLQQLLAQREGFDDVEIEVSGGIAHLTGVVDSWKTKQDADSLAMAVEDVVEVRNDLEIRQDSG